MARCSTAAEAPLAVYLPQGDARQGYPHGGTAIARASASPIAPFSAGKQGARPHMHNSMDDRLRCLEDMEAIRKLIASYGPLADIGDAQGVAALWAENGSYSVGDFGEAQGWEQIGALILSDTHQELLTAGCGHILTAPHITLDGDSAIAINHSVVFRKAGDNHKAWRVSANRWELVRTDDGWRVQHRHNRPLNGDGAARALLEV